MQLKKRLIRIGIPLLVILLILNVLGILPKKESFDLSLFNENNVYDHIKELSSEPYNGRMTGTEGNEKALKYIENCFKEAGIQPGGVNNTYYQPFSLIVPDIDTDPVFRIKPKDRNTVKEFNIYEDYNLLPSMNGGSVDFSGEIFLAGNSLFKTGREQIEDRVVIIKAKELTPEHIDYVINSGGKGVFCCAYDSDRYENVKDVSTSGKTGKSIAAGYISEEAYAYIESLAADKGSEEAGGAGVAGDAEIKAAVKYPVVSTSNIIGKIEGKSPEGEVLLITADIDGSGDGADGRYFPGAVSSASGTATMLEAARVMAGTGAVPYKTIVFIGFNGQRQQMAGSEYYINNPLYPLEDTAAIHLYAIGQSSREGLRIFSDRAEGIVVRDHLYEYAKDEKLSIKRAGFIDGTAMQFYEKDVDAVTLSDMAQTRDTYEDTIKNVSRERIKNASLALLNYVQKDIYKSREFNYSTFGERVSQFFRGISDSSEDSAGDIGKNYSVILTSILRSLKLLMAALLISMAIGIASGIYSGYKSKRRSLRSLGAIAALSIPDVLIVLLGWLVCILYAKNLPELKEVIAIHEYIVPLITLSILPTIYIFRITLITVQEEAGKDYIRNAIAKGFSKRKIYIELLPAALYKAVDTLPTIMTMLLSNLIVMEYLFNYLGAAYYLIYFFSRHAYFQFAALVAALALVYLVFTWAVRFAARLINPAKHEVKR
jgi:ABC-type dipeptide/oligopeptide/nickel transport system permease component